MPTLALNLSDDSILKVKCNEKNGIVERSIYKLALTPENLKIFWEKARVFPTLFGVEIREDFKTFLGVFLSQYPDGSIEGKGLLWTIDDMIGMFYLTEIDAGNDAIVHVSFFDGRIRGREQLACEMLKYVFETYQFRRLTAQIPMYAVEATHAFTRRVGFKTEGRKRQSSFFNNRWFDTVLYGILREEAK